MHVIENQEGNGLINLQRRNRHGKEPSYIQGGAAP